MASISVIVPVYNKWAYLQRSIDSILAQDVRGMEVVLVDDASTDGSGELCETLYGGRDGVRILHLPENGGAGAARSCSRMPTFSSVSAAVSRGSPGWLAAPS